MSNCNTKKQLQIALDALEVIAGDTYKSAASMSQSDLLGVVMHDQTEAAAALAAIKELGNPCSKLE